MPYEDLTRERQKSYEGFIRSGTIGTAIVAVLLFILVVAIIA